MRKVDTRQEELMTYINNISFAVQEALLFLDTHPNDMEALAFVRECTIKQKEALTLYAKEYSPLSIDTCDATDADYWNWIDQPWPWEL